MSGGRGGGRRKRRDAHEEEHENHERWAVSYADMMTVLVGLFIVMYAISQVDQTKFEQLRQSLAIGFGNQAPSMLEGSTGALTGVEQIEITPELTDDVTSRGELIVAARPGGGDADLSEEERELREAIVEYERLEAVAHRVAGALADKGLGDRVRFRVTERGLIIGMVADDVFFSAESADLTRTAKRVLDAIAPVLAPLPDEVSVEGHANILPVTGRYATNWELSSDRATQVLRRLVEVGGVAPDRIAAVGYGDARPLQDSALDPLEGNRRVDVVVLSGVPEDVRALLPRIAEES